MRGVPRWIRRSWDLAYWASGFFAGVLLIGGHLWAVVPAWSLIWIGARLHAADMAPRAER